MAEARIAGMAGVDSLELCSWPACGGVTPSQGLVQAISSAVSIPLRVLMRPGPGGFVHGADEIDQIMMDCRHMMTLGRHGLVVGALDEAGLVQGGFMHAVRALTTGREITFHRAIDQASDPLAVLDQCIALGMDRVLTSGGAAKALDGVPVLARMVQRAGRKIAVAAAGGIGPDNVVEVVERTGVMEVHFAAWSIAPPHHGRVPMSSADPGADRALLPDQAKIEGVLNALTKAGLR